MDPNVNSNSHNEDVATFDEDDLFKQNDNVDQLAIEKKLRVEDFRLLRRRFNRSEADSVDTAIKAIDKTAGRLNRDEFIDAFDMILDLNHYKPSLEKLFDKLNSKETGLISWNDFCTYMLQFYQEEDYENTLRISPFNNDQKIRHIPHNKQELTAKILHLENPVKFINISKEGYLGLWSTSLHLEKVYSAADELEDGLNTSLTGVGQRRRAGMWITDAIYLKDAHKLVLASTSRDIRFFTISNETFFEDYILFGVKNVPTCLDYYPSRQDDQSEAALMFGDDCGYIHILYFKNPVNALFDPLKRKTDTTKASNNPTHRIFWDELKEHEKYVRYYCMGAVHREYVRKILYIPHNNSIIASSGDSRNSLIIANVTKLKKPYVFRLYKGCECFDYNKDLNVLITGGADYLARIWNPYVTQKNTAILEGHHAAVVDIKINDRLVQCYTFSKDAILKAWDLKEFACLQTISLRFPSTFGGKTPSFGPFPTDLYLDLPTNSLETRLPGGLVLTCNDYICMMKFGQDTTKDESLTETHSGPISCAVFNSKLGQLITCSDNSSMGAWDIETGRKAFFITDAHDGEEITCVALDRPCRKIATGARDGIIKIWNSSNGQNLHILPSVEDAEITGILFSDKGIISVGWSRKIVKYPDIVSEDRTDDQRNVIEVILPKADLSWRGSQIHQDDILCLDNLLPHHNIMCTASYDGEINIWSIDTEKLITCLRKASKNEARRSLTSNRRQSHRKKTRGSIPVDKVLFLRHRAKESMKLGVLLSSEGGYIHCWSLYGERKEMGKFYAPSKSSESILAMSTDIKNRHLICGDTRGEIRVWNIENYCCSITPPVHFDSSPPNLLHSWQAHISPIIYCEWAEYKGDRDFIFTGSTDHTARLWTMNGEQIGIFGQRQQWDIDLLPSSKAPIEEDEEVNEKIIKMNIDEYEEKSVIIEKSNIVLPLDIPSDIKDEEIAEKRPLSSKTAIVSDSNQIFRSSSSLFTSSIVLQRGHTGLGISIERGLTQKKLTRQERRNRFSGVDGRHLVRGGGCVTPYALLFTQDVDENLTNPSTSSFGGKQMAMEDLQLETKDPLAPMVNTSSRNRLILPPIMTRQQTMSSFVSTASTIPFDTESTTRYGLPSRQNTFMKSISEIS